MSATSRFFVTLLFGWFGLHRFLDKKIGTGILYLFTFGLFGVGWIYDVIKSLLPLLPGNRTRKGPATPSKDSHSVQSFIDKKDNGDLIEKSSPKASNTYIFSAKYIERCRERFIAFDLETTGLSPESDRIIEISAILFEGFEPVNKFSTLVNPGMHIPPSASAVNGITDSDVKNAPGETQAIRQFCDFVGNDVLSGDVVLVAHNALFDIKFLLHAMSRSGIDADLNFQDTLYMSRKWSIETEDHKLGTLAKHFGFEQSQAHRAGSDAEVCGKIFVELLNIRSDEQKKRFSALSELEQKTCLWIKMILDQAGCNTELLSFSSSTYLAAVCLYTVLKCKPKAKKPYMLVKSDAAVSNLLQTAPATKSEGADLIRVFYNNPEDLEPLREWIVREYQRCYDSAVSFSNLSSKNARQLGDCIQMQICI